MCLWWTNVISNGAHRYEWDRLTKGDPETVRSSPPDAIRAIETARQYSEAISQSTAVL